MLIRSVFNWEFHTTEVASTYQLHRFSITVFAAQTTTFMWYIGLIICTHASASNSLLRSSAQNSSNSSLSGFGTWAPGAWFSGSNADKKRLLFTFPCCRCFQQFPAPISLSSVNRSVVFLFYRLYLRLLLPQKDVSSYTTSFLSSTSLHVKKYEK